MSESNELLNEWVNEQKTRFNKMIKQLDLIENLESENLDMLGENLEDIDFHCAALSNILDMIIGPIENSNDTLAINAHTELEMDNKNEKKWPLLKALWFHTMMITDPESIYYSPNICAKW